MAKYKHKYGGNTIFVVYDGKKRIKFSPKNRTVILEKKLTIPGIEVEKIEEKKDKKSKKSKKGDE